MRGDGFKKYETNFFPKNHPPIRGDEGGWFLGVTVFFLSDMPNVYNLSDQTVKEEDNWRKCKITLI